MKRYDLVVGFGCSFMQGGGLDNIELYKKLNNIEREVDIKEAEEFRYKNNFVAYLADILKCDYINFGESRCPNELIFENIYNYFNHKKIDKNILMIGQASLFNRLYTFYEKTNEFTKLNMLDFQSPPFSGKEIYKELYEYYEYYLKYIWNEQQIYKALDRNINTYTSWLQNMNVDCIWISYDGTSDKFKESKNFIKFDGDNLGTFIHKNKLRLCDIDELNTGDLHMSIEGHKTVAELLIKKIKND